MSKISGNFPGEHCHKANTLVLGLADNSASYNGGGACYGTLNNCTLSGNSASSEGGATYYAALNNCTISGNSADTGGGVCYGIVSNCTFNGNVALGSGGGACYCTLNNCTLSGDSAAYGGGAYESALNNCTLSANSASTSIGGAYSCTLNNCIIFYNTAPDGNYSRSTLNYCCTTPLPASGVGNLTNEPLFVNTNGWSDLRLKANSPCINAGDNGSVTTATDLDGNPRISGGRVDIGAYEFQSPPPVLLADGALGVRSNRFGFGVGAAPGGVVVIEASTNLAKWDAVQTNTLDAVPTYFGDSGWTNFPARFYRARWR